MNYPYLLLPFLQARTTELGEKMVDKVDAFFRRKWKVSKEQVYGLFNEFNKPLNDRDDESKIFTVVCDDVVGGHGVTDEGLHKCFCKALIGNLGTLRNNSSTYKLNGETKNLSAIEKKTRCDLLNLWLFLYVLKYNMQKNDILYAFTAMSNLKDFFFMESEDCTYDGTFTVNEKEDGDGIFGEICRWFMKQGIISRMEAINNRTACNKVSRSENKDSTFPQKTPEKKSPKAQDIADKVVQKIEELRPIFKKIEEELAQQPPPEPGDDCTNKKTLCERVTCVANKWKTDKQKTDYNEMWEDVGKRVPDLFEAISKPTPHIDNNYCYGNQWKGQNVTFEEIEACRLIVRGLHHIYSTQTDDVKQDEKAKNEQRFNEAMECLLLNAYAEELKKKAQERGNCKVDKGIKHAFQKSKDIKKDTSPCKGEGDMCQVCQKEEYRNCKINDQNIKDKLDELLQKKEGEIEQTLEELCKDCRKVNDLCKRAQCVTINWFRDRLTNGGEGRQNWCRFWDTDVKGELEKLSKAIIKEDKSDEPLCNNINGKNTATEAEKKACQYITRGLEYIYGIREQKGQNYLNQQKNNPIFYRTIGCAFLNVYADRLQQLKPSKCNVQNGIDHAFEKSNEIKGKTSPCNSDSKCFVCTRHKGLSCTLSVEDKLLNERPGQNCEKDRKNIKNKLDDMLDKDNTGIKQTLDHITTICKPKPAALPPAPPSAPSEAEDGRGGEAGEAALKAPKAEPLTDKKGINPFLPYFPLAPATIGITVMSYLLWKYFGMLRKARKRYKRAPKALGPSLEQQILDHVDQLGPREYYLVKERKPRSTPIKRRKKRGAGRRGGVRRRMIIDIHFEVLDECQKGDTKLVPEDFFEILVQEFMGSEFMKEENVPKEQVQRSGSGFREGRLCS
ncbi:SICA antigen [Plasmodium coatneyi]|uniref:SICA antigen n=1 Tax=Plasmodium coatneyi TaxID=208452 RepID=A0A1B1DUN6_9APIC|nr:SICA antigen [Plasmodium coatneyi]ANQ06501.1 SICA antigen [Plasmodium coatneyi]